MLHKVLYMDTQHPPQETIQDIRSIKRMMERSSRFISLSGWSGVAAGICALGGAYAAWSRLQEFRNNSGYRIEEGGEITTHVYNHLQLFTIIKNRPGLDRCHYFCGRAYFCVFIHLDKKPQKWHAHLGQNRAASYLEYCVADGGGRVVPVAQYGIELL